MLFFTALRARCASSEQRALLKPETITTSCEARKLLPATEGKKLDQVTLSLGLGIPDSRKRVAKHLGPCISAWTRRLKSEELDQPHQQQLRIADLRSKRKCERLCGLRVLSSDINGKRKQHDQVKHLGPLRLTGRNASSHTGMWVLKSMLTSTPESAPSALSSALCQHLRPLLLYLFV